MKIVNHTPFPVFIAHDYMSDAWLRVEATTKVTCSLDGELRIGHHQNGISLPTESSCLSEVFSGDPRKFVEVTVEGTVAAPSAFTERTLTLQVGEHTQAVRVFGPRAWERCGARVVPSAPLPIERVDMSWANAYGGQHHREPGLVPHTDLPGPSLRIAWPQNPSGIGFYLDEDAAIGQPVPHLEDPENLIAGPCDRPNSRCWAPMPADSSLRVAHLRDIDERKLASTEGYEPSVVTRMLAQAPPELQFEGVVEGAEVRVEGFDPARPLQFVLPPPAFSWEVRTAGRTVRPKPSLWWIKIDASKRLCELLYWTRMVCPLIRREERVFEQRLGSIAPHLLPSEVA